MRFKFRLESFLRHWTLKEGQKRRESIEIRQQLNDVIEGYKGKKQGFQDLVERRNQDWDPAWVSFQTQCTELMASELEALADEARGVHRRLEEREEELLIAGKKKRALEDLKDKQHRVHKREQMRIEQKKLDEAWQLVSENKKVS